MEALVICRQTCFIGGAYKTTEKIPSPRGKREGEDPLQAKRADNFQSP